MMELESKVINMNIDRDYISEEKKFDHLNENVSQSIDSNVTQMEIGQLSISIASQNMQEYQDQMMKEQQYEYDRIGCLINIDDQVVQLGIQLASIIFYNKEEYKIEEFNQIF